MKFIKNSIDSEYLQDSISDADLEAEMANCEVKSDVFNGHHSVGIKILDKKGMEDIEVNKLSNGIHGPTKSNGKVNGFYEEEEDFNLVLEDSSEGGSSPMKKIDDDTISAPRIVQEIEDLLGINSSSAVIQEELNNLDGTESVEDNLDNLEDIEESDVIQEVLEDTTQHKGRESHCDVDGERTEEIKKQTDISDKQSEITECNTSSNMDLVFDEVEVGMDNGDSVTPNACSSTSKPVDSDCKVESTTEANPDKVEDFVVNNTKNAIIREDDNQVESSEKLDVSIENKTDEIPMTQSSSMSGNSEEWTVLDSVETSDDEKISEITEPSVNSLNSVDDIPVSKSSVETLNEEKLSEVTETSVNSLNLVDDIPVAKFSDTIEDMSVDADRSVSTLNDKERSNNSFLAISCENEELESQTDSIISLTDQVSTKTLDNEIEMCETKSSSSLQYEGDGVRKRCASLSDEDVELKKPKLEDQSNLVESSSPGLKRPSIVDTENECKRSKIVKNKESDELNKKIEDEDGHVYGKPDSVGDNIEDDLIGNDSGKNEINILENSKVLVSTTDEKFLDEIPVESLVSNKEEESHNCVSQKSPVNSDLIQTPTITEKLHEKLTQSDVTEQCSDEDDQNVSKSSLDTTSMPDADVTTSKEDKISLITTSAQQTDTSTESRNEDKPHCNQIDSENYENKENLISSSIDDSKEDTGFKLDDLSTIDNKEPSKVESVDAKSSFQPKSENKITCTSKQEVSISKELSTSIKELEKSIIKGGLEKGSTGDVKDVEPKKMTNLDFAIERVVEKARIQTEKRIPILKKFHKDQLKKLKRSELEDVVVSKICEAVTYKSEIGQMRLRTQNLEETNEMWRKKVQQIEKQNRELEMVLKRFLAELSHIKRENQNKVPMPIKVTRSVGLQVVLASSMHGALVSSRNKMNNEANQHQQMAKLRAQEKEKPKEPVKATTFIPPSQSSLARGRGRPPKAVPTQNSRPSTPQTLSPKITPPTTPSKPATITPVKIIPSPNKDLEVIDLTDKEERAKSNSQSPVSGSIRVAPSTQVCFVQQSAAPTPPQQPLYLVQKAGQRPQFLVATSSASPQRPNSAVSRPPPALALPVFRAGGHLIPVQTTPQVGIKTNTSTTPTTVARQVTPSNLRLQSQTSVSKHPAPLPLAPAAMSKPGMKAPPPKPQLKIAKTTNGIMLSWSMCLSKEMAEMQSYQLYAYQEGNQPPSTGLWKKVGDVKALPLPMACTLTQFIEGHKYHFAVRAVDTHGRIGPFSTPSSILLTK